MAVKMPTTPFTFAPAAPAMSATVQQLVEKSAANFENYLMENLGHFAHVPQIREKVKAWVDDYKKEAGQLAVECYEEGKRNAPAPPQGPAQP